MSLMAEQIVEEWLNRRGFFTIRGARVGTGEIDLLAIRPADVGMDCWHFEVQGSLRPVSYICPVPSALRKTGIAPHNAKRRPQNIMQDAVREWTRKKFFDQLKFDLRQKLCKSEWRFGLVLGNIKFQDEAQAIQEIREGNARIEIFQLATIIAELEPRKRVPASSDLKLDAAGGNDFIELLWAQKNLK